MRTDPIVALLPVRNGLEDLPGWLSVAADWCDAVVALDDGSTDGTAAVLEEHDLVQILLRRPPRPTAAGWDDGANRDLLLQAAAALRPAWIVQVDVDERIPPADAALLRAFLRSPDALPGVAYGLRHVRMWGPDRCDPRSETVYRVFAWEPGHRMPPGRLHVEPVPTQILGRVPTSIRLQHLGTADEHRIAARTAKYREADPEGRWPMSFGGLDGPPDRTIAWSEERDPTWPLLLPRGLASPIVPSAVPPPLAEARAEHPLLAVLLPVRNGERDLPGWLDHVRGLADAVVALDDGSTDATRALLQADPLVRLVLANPPRPTWTGWDDRANRQRLLEGASAIAPRWVLFLDVDERICDEDRSALRAFLASGEADPEAAYLFRVLRMVDPDRYDRAELQVARLFAWRPGLELEGPRLHLVPVPSTIPPSRWIPTTLRICHLATVDEERRRARLEKYREADPDGWTEGRYRNLAGPVGMGRPLEPRTPGEPVVLDPVARATSELAAPAISAIVIAQDEGERIVPVLRAVTSQEVSEPFEVIAVVSGSPRTAALVRARFPEVRLVELAHPVLPGAARNAGVARATGDIVSFPGSHILLSPGSLQRRLDAHRRGYAMVTGGVRNANRTRAGWASYLLDHAPVLPGRPAGELPFAPPHCSYDREVLETIGGFREDLRAGEDTIVNNELFRRGYRAWFDPRIELWHRSPCRTLPQLVRHHARRGLGLAAVVEATTPAGSQPWREALARGLGFGVVPRRLRSIHRHAAACGFDRIRRRVVPELAIAATAAWLATWWGLARAAIRSPSG